MSSYRIVSYEGAYAVQTKGWDSLWIWVLWCPGQMDSPPGIYPSIPAAQQEIERIKPSTEPQRVVWSNSDKPKSKPMSITVSRHSAAATRVFDAMVKAADLIEANPDTAYVNDAYVSPDFRVWIDGEFGPPELLFSDNDSPLYAVNLKTNGWRFWRPYIDPSDSFTAAFYHWQHLVQWAEQRRFEGRAQVA